MKYKSYAVVHPDSSAIYACFKNAAVSKVINYYEYLETSCTRDINEFQLLICDEEKLLEVMLFTDWYQKVTAPA